MRLERALPSSQVSQWVGAGTVVVPSRPGYGVVAFAPTVTAYSAYYDVSVPERVWDSNSNTAWNTSSSSPAWQNVDFGVPLTVGKVGLASQSAGRFWDVYGSTDGSSWNLVAGNCEAVVQATPVLYSFPPVTYRYWRFYASSGSWTDPHTFQLWYA